MHPIQIGNNPKEVELPPNRLTNFNEVAQDKKGASSLQKQQN